MGALRIESVRRNDTVRMNEAEKKFIESQRVGRLATVTSSGEPHVVPVCFVRDGDTVYITIDEKPKRDRAKPLQRVQNIQANPSVALVLDHFEEEWTRLGWVMLRGEAEVLEEGSEHDRAQSLLRARYPQYREMALESLPVIAIRVERTTSWGKLA